MPPFGVEAGISNLASASSEPSHPLKQQQQQKKQEFSFGGKVYFGHLLMQISEIK